MCVCSRSADAAPERSADAESEGSGLDESDSAVGDDSREVVELKLKLAERDAHAAQLQLLAAQLAAQMAAVNAEAAANKASALRAQKELKLTQDRLAKSERASEQVTSVSGVTATAELAKQAAASEFTPATKAEASAARKPNPFSGEGDQGSAAGVSRFIDSLLNFFGLTAIRPVKWVQTAVSYLEGSAADYVNTALRSCGTTAAERLDWTYFCSLLRAGYGQIDLEAEYWDTLQNLTQGLKTADEYRHAVQQCFAGITTLPLSEGDMIQRFMTGLNPHLRERVLTAPIGMGDNCGKWLHCKQLMDYTVSQARALLNGGAVTSGSVGQKRRDEDVGQVANTGGKRSKTAHAKSPSNNGQKRPFRSQQQRDWLKCKNLCWHCCLPGHSSPTCDKRGQPPAAMPAGFRQAKTAALAQSKA